MLLYNTLFQFKNINNFYSSQLSASYDKLQEQLAVLSVAIEENKCNLEPLQKQYDEALRIKNSALEKNR